MFLSTVVLAVTGFLMSSLSFRMGILVRGPLVVQAHDLFSIILILLIITHIVLHIDWFKKVLRKKRRSKW